MKRTLTAAGETYTYYDLKVAEENGLTGVSIFLNCLSTRVCGRLWGFHAKHRCKTVLKTSGMA